MLGALCIAIVCGLLAAGTAWLIGFGGWVALMVYAGIGIVVFLGVLAARVMFVKSGVARQVRVASNSEKS